MKYLNTFILCSLLVQGCLTASESISKNDSSLSQFQFTGQTLINLGIKLDKPFLKLIGKTMVSVEDQIKTDNSSQYKIGDVVAEFCRLHPCSEWSDWSKCDANHVNEFGGQTRSRNCGLNTTICKHYSTPTVVQDTRVCEHHCPKDYTSTGHGFCLKFYDNQKMARDDAEKACQADGGHLVNVDSGIKVQYVNETIQQHGFSGQHLWIDGRRYQRGGPFTYGYKAADPTFTFWGDNDPDNGVKDLCKKYYQGSETNYIWRWFDYPCESKYAFICQYQ